MKNNWFLKIIALSLVYMVGCTLHAQGLLIQKKDGTQIKIPYEQLDFVTVYEPESETDILQSIAGDYKGNNVKKVGLQEKIEKDNVASLRLQKDNKFTVVLPEAKQAAKSMEMPHVELPNLALVKESEDIYTFALQSTKVNSENKVVEVKNLTGKVNRKNNTLELIFEIKPGKMPFFIKNNFTGKKQHPA